MSPDGDKSLLMHAGKDKVPMPCTILQKVVPRKRKYLQKCKMLEGSSTTTLSYTCITVIILYKVTMSSITSSISSSSPSASAGSSPSVAILASKVAAVDIESLSSPKKLSPKKLVVPLANVSINTDHDVEGTKVATAVDFSNTTMADLVLSDEGTTPWKQVNKKKNGPIDRSCLLHLVLALQVIQPV